MSQVRVLVGEPLVSVAQLDRAAGESWRVTGSNPVRNTNDFVSTHPPPVADFILFLGLEGWPSGLRHWS